MKNFLARKENRLIAILLVLVAIAASNRYLNQHSTQQLNTPPSPAPVVTPPSPGADQSFAPMPVRTPRGAEPVNQIEKTKILAEQAIFAPPEPEKTSQ